MLHILDLQLNTLKVVDHDFKNSISVLKAEKDLVALGDNSGNVIVFNSNGEILLVSFFRSTVPIFRTINIEICITQFV